MSDIVDVHLLNETVKTKQLNKMYKISKEFHFSAAHKLEGLPADHPCSNLHGHNYIVIVELEASELNEVGFVTDYRKLSPIKEFIDKYLDHQNLNDALDFNPTVENIAKFLFKTFEKTFPQMVTITVKETPGIAVTYSPMFDAYPDKIG